MAGTIITMSQLKQIVRLFILGYSIKRITRETGVSRNTIKAYRRIIEFREINIQELLKMDDLQLEQLLRSPVATEKERQRDFMTRLKKFFEDLKHLIINYGLYKLCIISSKVQLICKTIM